MNEQLILVDRFDNIVGYGEKTAIHKSGSLHRAFSLFIYNKCDQTVLLQKRASTKYHSGGLWSNSCCSHQYCGENWAQSIHRCLSTELGISLSSPGRLENAFTFSKVREFDNIIKIGSFMYYSDYGDMKEHEIDHVFIWCTDTPLLKKISANPNEVSLLKWVSPSEIERLLIQKPYIFTSWFYPAYTIAKQVITDFSNM